MLHCVRHGALPFKMVRCAAVHSLRTTWIVEIRTANNILKRSITRVCALPQDILTVNLTYESHGIGNCFIVMFMLMSWSVSFIVMHIYVMLSEVVE